MSIFIGFLAIHVSSYPLMDVYVTFHDHNPARGHITCILPFHTNVEAV
jgi:hypothetical protein